MSSSCIFYLCRINSYIDQSRFGYDLHIGPAYQKLIHVSKALRSAGTRVSLVAVPVCNELKIKDAKINTVVSRERGVRIISLGAIPGRVLSRIYASVAFLAFVIRCVREKDRVIIYNFFPEYILATLYLFFRKRRAILDIEDAPRADESGLVSVVTRVSFSILRFLCKRECITVSTKIAEKFQLQNPLVVYGASPPSSNNRSILHADFKNNTKSIGTVRVLYGGSMLPETGLNIFCAAVEILVEKNVHPKFNLELLVTGFGGDFELGVISKFKFPSWLQLNIKQDLDFSSYEALLRSGHIGLCLKVPGTSMADTTFPSKVVEIIRSGLLLITTPTSDVPLLFDENQIIQIQQPYANALASILFEIANAPYEFIDVADAGIIRADELFSYPGVGRRMQEWLNLIH